jgi:CRP-like cAMP-binding protein
MTHTVSPKLRQAIDGSALFKKLPERQRDVIKAAAKLRAYLPGQKLLSEGDRGGDVLLIRSGRVSVHAHGAGGEVTLAELGPGAVLGEVASVTGTPRTSTAEALDVVEAVWIPEAIMQELLGTHPSIRELLLKVIEHRAEAALEKLVF